jgi:hypothetical protein
VTVLGATDVHVLVIDTTDHPSRPAASCKVCSWFSTVCGMRLWPSWSS